MTYNYIIADTNSLDTGIKCPICQSTPKENEKAWVNLCHPIHFDCLEESLKHSTCCAICRRKIKESNSLNISSLGIVTALGTTAWALYSHQTTEMLYRLVSPNLKYFFNYGAMTVAKHVAKAVSSRLWNVESPSFQDRAVIEILGAVGLVAQVLYPEANVALPLAAVAFVAQLSLLGLRVEEQQIGTFWGKIGKVLSKPQDLIRQTSLLAIPLIAVLGSFVNP